MRVVVTIEYDRDTEDKKIHIESVTKQVDGGGPEVVVQDETVGRTQSYWPLDETVNSELSVVVTRY